MFRRTNNQQRINDINMNEMTKSHPSRIRAGDYQWLKGRVLDIGCGPDPIVLDAPSTVRGWDLPDGDAQYLQSIENSTFDVIVASHVLEHVVDVQTTLKSWSRVLVEGGYCYILVPDYRLYEKLYDFSFGLNPSRFNGDHKSSLSLENLVHKPRNHPHYGFKEMRCMGLEAGLTLIDCRIEADFFDWKLITSTKLDQTRRNAQAQLCFIYQKL